MRAAFVMFNRMTALDFVGVYDTVGRLKTMNLLADFSWTVAALSSAVEDDRGLRFGPQTVNQPLAGYDLLVLPGGFGTRELVHDQGFIEWLQTARDVPLKASVCTGSLLLGAAGFLQGKPATTHPNAFGELARFCSDVRRGERVVDAGEVVTVRGVTASIDLGLHLVERIAGAEACRRIRTQIDYPHDDRFE